MKNPISSVQQELAMIMKHVPTGLAEITIQGEIIYLNLKAESLLKPIRIAHGIRGNNLYPILEVIAPPVVDKIKNSPPSAGNIVESELHSFSLSFGEENVERHFNYSITKRSGNCIVVSFDDVTENRLKETAIMQLVADKAVEQGKFEIASNVLHDIGNAIVGFGSYINRIRRTLENNQPDTVNKFSSYISTQQPAFATILGDAKADALVTMVQSISESQKKHYEEITKSIKEQQNIINHIQEILIIQRQYLNGHTLLEKKPTDLKGIIKDCMSMLYASIEKRSISVSINITSGLPPIHADHTRLMQVLLNLLKNSIEAIGINSDEKHISINARTNDKELVLEVQDSGQGFDEATGRQLFVRGFTTKASGTGLGLANCKAIIESHNGTIGIVSEGFGKGATTTIKFKI